MTEAFFGNRTKFQNIFETYQHLYGTRELLVDRGCDYGTLVRSFYQQIELCARIKKRYYMSHCVEQDPISGFQLPSVLFCASRYLCWSTLRKPHFPKPQPIPQPWFQVVDDYYEDDDYDEVLQSILGV